MPGRGPRRTLAKDMRIRRRAEYVSVQSNGQKLHGRHLLALAQKRSDPSLVGRLGITVTKKVGNAVVRNRIKRLCFSNLYERLIKLSYL